MKHTIALEVNGLAHRLDVEAGRLLVEVIREDLGLTGTKRGCESNICGTCTVLVNGLSVHACCLLAVQANGKQITTIEGLGRDGKLHPVQQAFVDESAMQCGYCIPGFIMAAAGLLSREPRPGSAQIREALSENMCRCGAYQRIQRAVEAAAQRRAAQTHE